MLRISFGLLLVPLLLATPYCGRTAPITPPGTTTQCPIGTPPTGMPFSVPIIPVPDLLARCGVNGEATTALTLSGSVFGTVGARTDLTFPTLVVSMTFSTVPCGGTTTRPPARETFINLRYRAENNTGAGCVARSRVDYDPILPTGDSGFGPLLTVFGQQILLPELDKLLLPPALAVQSGCRIPAIGTSNPQPWCAGWSPL